MKTNILYILLSVGILQLASCNIENYGDHYIVAWKKFYPSKSFDQGFQSSIFQVEDYSKQKIDSWLAFNQSTLTRLSSPGSTANGFDKIDSRLLITQAKTEVVKWKDEKIHTNSLLLYASIISSPFKKFLSSEVLTEPEKIRILCLRLDALSHMCESARKNLKWSTIQEIERGVDQLRLTQEFINSDLSKQLKNQHVLTLCPDYNQKKENFEKSIQSLIEFATAKLLPKATETEQVLGKDAFAISLRHYVDDDLTPDQLAQMALEEIEDVKTLILKESKSYILSSYSIDEFPTSDSAIIALAFDDMEKDAPTSGEEYLLFWKSLKSSAVQFLRDKDLVTLPEHETLRIMTAPESAGPAARIGWVDVAPPFAPNPLTTLYLPSIPDTLDGQEQIDFWSSFNKPFNRMIVIHELYPGHYMQYYVARASPHPIRLLFPYGPYTEGWASFCEMIALDAGWEAERPLTYIAHLRKRLENANRAYTSVMVHCNGWDEEKVMNFSIKSSLLAPQFAKSLWGRLMRSPMQITSYYFGGQQFRDLLAYEKERLGSSFVLKEFMDTILKSGPIPIDEFYKILENSKISVRDDM